MFLLSILKSGANFGEIIICILAVALAAMTAIVTHEYFHGYAAYKCGDHTAKAAGRLTLNPVAHFDLFGLAMIVLVGFGWAKPVPIDPRNFKNYKKGMILVSVSGVTANLIMCGIGLLLLFILGPVIFYSQAASIAAQAGRMLLYYFLNFFIRINFMLAFFNLMPIYPLDGFRLLDCFLPHGNAFSRFMYKNGNMVLIGLIVISMVFRNFGLYYLDVFSWGNYLITKLIGLVT